MMSDQRELLIRETLGKSNNYKSISLMDTIQNTIDLF